MMGIRDTNFQAAVGQNFMLLAIQVIRLNVHPNLGVTTADIAFLDILRVDNNHHLVVDRAFFQEPGVNHRKSTVIGIEIGDFNTKGFTRFFVLAKILQVKGSNFTDDCTTGNYQFLFATEAEKIIGLSQ